MARCLPVCLLLVLLAILVLECECRLPPLRKKCCFIKGCFTNLATVPCCSPRKYCYALRGRRGVCRFRPKCQKGRDAEDTEEGEVPDTRDAEGDNRLQDALGFWIYP